MKVGFRQSFTRDLAKVKNKGLLKRVKIAIETLESAESIEQIKGLKKLRGVGNHYRLRSVISGSALPWKKVKLFSCVS